MHWSEQEYAIWQAQQARRGTERKNSIQSTEREEAWLNRVLAALKWHGYKVYHTRDSRHSAAGYPDITAAKAGAPLLMLECKSVTGKPTMEQLAWLETLARVTGVDARLVRPGDWEGLIERLR